MTLQDPASTAESSHKDVLRHCREDWRSSCSRSSNRRPAKTRVLTKQTARKAQPFTSTISAASAILTCNGLALGTLNGSPSWLYTSVFDAAMPSSSSFSIAPQQALGDTFNKITMLSSPQTALLRMLSDHTRNTDKPWTQCTFCWQGNCAD